jgi:hypothetical protein
MNGHRCISIKLYLQKHTIGWIWPRAFVCWPYCKVYTRNTITGHKKSASSTLMKPNLFSKYLPQFIFPQGKYGIIIAHHLLLQLLVFLVSVTAMDLHCPHFVVSSPSSLICYKVFVSIGQLNCFLLRQALPGIFC